MKIKIKDIKRLIKEAINPPESVEDDIGTLQVGDIVDTMGDEFGDFEGVRILELVDDVQAVTGVEPDNTSTNFEGPGFVGLTPEGDQLVFTLDQVVPGSKLKGYFPKLGTTSEDGLYDDYDDWNREVPNPYRKLASKLSR